MKFYDILDTIDKYADQFSVNMTREAEIREILDNTPESTLREWYHEVYDGQCSNDGEMGEDLAKTAHREQLVQDLLFAAGI